MKLLNKTLFLLFLLNLTISQAFAQEQPAESQVIMQKFGITIGLVIVCSLVLFTALYLYKKYFIEKSNDSIEQQIESPLKKPSNLSEAIESFLEKTKPNQ